MHYIVVVCAKGVDLMYAFQHFTSMEGGHRPTTRGYVTASVNKEFSHFIVIRHLHALAKCISNVTTLTDFSFLLGSK